MRTLKRNKQVFYSAHFVDKEMITETDEYGNVSETGEWRITRTWPVKHYGNISPAKGVNTTQDFGINIDYDLVIVMDNIDCPFTESDVFWIDVEPETENYNYVATRIAKSINSFSIAVKRVHA